MRLKYNFIGLILACGLGLSSCNDSFLDRNPKDQLSDASFWKNAEDAQKFATGIYRFLIADSIYFGNANSKVQPTQIECCNIG